MVVVCSATVMGQADKEDPEKSGSNTIGIGIGMAYLVNETDWAPGLHLHYSRALGEKQNFSLGTGMELIIGEHQHAGVSLAMEYAPFAGLSLGYGPCLEIPISSNTDHGMELIHHIEISYEFELRYFHIGPMVEYGFNRDDKHMMLGLHTGYNF